MRTVRVDDRRRVLLLAVASTIVFLEMGTLFALAVFVKPIEEAMGWPRSYIAGVAGLNWIALGFGAMAGGALSDRIGLRVIAVVGAVLVGGGTVLASQAAQFWQFTVAFGVLPRVLARPSDGAWIDCFISHPHHLREV
jgi:MFS family permease